MKDFLDTIVEYSCMYDAIVVEGYDGVGKGRVLNQISDILGVIPYRPDYNLWQKYDHRQKDRWKVSGFFWDVLSHFGHSTDKIMLFDRGVLSGAVYNNDMSIARDYPNLLRSMQVLHILVVCDKDDYYKFSKIRLPDIDIYEIDKMWEEYLEYENRYRDCFEISGVDYIIYKNVFDDTIAEELSSTCEGCGHYSYGICRHPKKNNCRVDPKASRCEYSEDREVQDKNGTEMYIL